MKPRQSTFDHARFDALCTQIQETGRGSLVPFDPDSDFVAEDILREAARVIGVRVDEYEIFPEGSGLITLVVRRPGKA